MGARQVTQPNLFDESATAAVALARTSDPDTSRAAADGIAAKLNHCQQVMLDAIRHMQPFEEPTAGEAAGAAYEIDQTSAAESYRKRLGELLRLGRVVETGKRRCRVTGKSARTFRVK
jgi:hypothetical protein